MAPVTPMAYNGRYELTEHIARGGMAEVYLAKDLFLNRPVALKVLFPELSVDKAFVERFRREAQAAANLTHPNIVSVFDWGEAERTYFIVMEYVNGQVLSNLIRTNGPLEPRHAAEITAEVASALTYAHNHGVIHRDVKPGNVLIAGDGQVKVTDFGIARAKGAGESLTQTGAVMGTATYFSPEQAQGEGVDTRTDIYSLGVVLYEMVTGQAPFKGENPLSIAYKHVKEQPVAPRELNPAVPAELEAVILHAMAKDPTARYQTAAEMRADLLRFTQGAAVLAPPPTSVLAAAAAGVAQSSAEDPVTQVVMGNPTRVHQAISAADVPGAAAAPQEDEGKSRTVLWILLALVLLALAAFLLYDLGIVGGKTTVPNVVGSNLSVAENTLSTHNLRYTVSGSHSPAAKVVSESPTAGQRVQRNSAVSLTTAPPEKVVPNVVSSPYAQAYHVLRAAGFRVQQQAQQGTGQTAGTVLSQSPTGLAPVGTTVTLVVAVGNNLVQVPDVSFDSVSTAANILGQAGFSIGNMIHEYSTTVPAGKVITSQPGAGTPANPNTPIDLYVSQGSPPASTTTTTTAPTTTTTAPTTTAPTTTAAPTTTLPGTSG